MKAFKKIVVMILMCLLVVPFTGNTVYASSGTISLSDPTVEAGESVSVTVKATTADSSTISSVTMELTYDTKILEFESGTSATNEDGIIKISGTADSSIKTYTLTFKALKAGTSAIKISSYEIKDSKSSVIDMSKVGSSTVTVTGEDTKDASTLESTTNETDTDVVQTENNQTVESEKTLEDKIVSPPKKDVEVEIAGTLFDICKISEDIIPEGFEYIGYMYGDVAVDAVRKDNIVLFYLNQIGEEPYIFYLYDDETGGFFKYAPVAPCLNYSVIDADESVVIPDGFTASAVSVGGVAVNGWQSDANSEYFLLYLMTSEGKKNLYLYDTVEKTVQRFNGTAIEQSQADSATTNYETLYTELNKDYNEDIQSKTSLVYGLIVLVVILVFITINLALRLSDKHHSYLDEEDEEDEEYEEDEEEYEEDSEIEEEYDDLDEFEDDYESDEDKSEYISDRQRKKEAKKAAKLEKREKAQSANAVKKGKASSKTDLVDETDNEEEDDFEMQVFDLDDDK